MWWTPLAYARDGGIYDVVLVGFNRSSCHRINYDVDEKEINFLDRLGSVLDLL